MSSAIKNMKRLSTQIGVVFTEGQPVKVDFGNSRMRAVHSIYERWRVQGRWWMKEEVRDYYVLEIEGKGGCIVYRDSEKRWYLAGIID